MYLILLALLSQPAPALTAPIDTPPPMWQRERQPAEPAMSPAYTTAPKLLNREQVRIAMMRNYPVREREQKIGAKVFVWVHLDQHGAVADAKVKQTAGPAFDAAALRVAKTMRFSPALNQLGEPIAVWVSIPISFCLVCL